MISRPAKLRRERYSLAIIQEDTAHVPFEDIAIIVLDHHEITLTHPVLSACAEFGIGLFSTGDDHQPNGVFTPFLQHTRTTRMMRLQLGLGRPLVKRAWARIVRQKISNQAICLKLANCADADRLHSLVNQVRSGDPDRREGQAAMLYFNRLFGRDFHRGQNTWTNGALNYGYAVVRGAITRCLVKHGLHPSLGLFHASEQNAFNLADDIIEPFRPVVDLFVVGQRRDTTTTELCSTDKVALVKLLNVDVDTPRGAMSVMSAINLMVESAVRMMERADEQCMEMPKLIELRQHEPYD